MTTEQGRKVKLDQMRDQLWAKFRDQAESLARIGDGGYQTGDDILVRQLACMAHAEILEQARTAELAEEGNWQETEEWRNEAWAGIRREKEAITRILETGPISKDDIALCRRILYFTLGQINGQEADEV